MIMCRVCGGALDAALARVGWGLHPNCADERDLGDDIDHDAALRLLQVTLPHTRLQTSRITRATNPPNPTQGALL